MTVTDAAYIAALEKRLIDAERALYGFRAIFNNFREQRVGIDEITSLASPAETEATLKKASYLAPPEESCIE